MKDNDCVKFLQWLLPQLQMRWPGFRKVRRQVCKRVDHRMAELSLPDIAVYGDWIESHPEELATLDSICRITISRFYRDRGVFDRLRDEILPELAATAQSSGTNEVRCWSAGCASGEEPYTIKMIWDLAVSPRIPDVRLRIVATDVNEQMLDRAKRGRYPGSSVKDFPREWLTSCFEKVEDEYSIRPEYRTGIEWCCQDVRQQTPQGSFDLILCRHLAFTYFDETVQVDTLSKIISELRPGGILVAGKQESLPEVITALSKVQPKMGIYRRS